MVKFFKRIFIFGLIIATVAYFSIEVLMGPKGLVNLIRLNKEVSSSSLELSELVAYKNKIEKKIKGLNEKSLDLDLLDEHVRRVLGYADRNEIVIYHNN
ncbi:MAG: septum formation initiator family protein [Rickettsiaceae bacterium H1]|nr:septum formation initiator family protein [Rickettsiaceae bacterium H1]